MSPRQTSKAASRNRPRASPQKHGAGASEPAVGFGFTGNRSASNKMPRTINRNLVFNLIRTRQPLSRADLARVSGLQRSTVSLIVKDLIAEQWVVESSTERIPRGRRPTFLNLNDQRGVLALDIHTSQTTVAVVDLSGRIVAQNVVDLPADPRKAVDAILREVKKTLANDSNRRFDGIGLGVPGRPEFETEPRTNADGQPHPAFTPRIKWSILQLQTRLQRATSLPVRMDNVANACALSEVWFGDSDGLHDLVVVNVSEGIGAGIFANGRILRGSGGMAGEFGHIQVDADGPPCACGSQGCWETFASNRAGLRYYEELTRRPAPVSFDVLVRMAQSGDAIATKALLKMSVSLGRGLRMIASSLAPTEIVVVGEITDAWYLFGPTIEAEMRRSSLPQIPRLRPSVEARTARLRSSLALIMSKEASL